MNTSTEDRGQLYAQLHEGQLTIEEASNRYSARKIFDLVWPLLSPCSLLDVGCGLGTWISVAKEYGAKEVVGLDGPWVQPANLICPSDIVLKRDLESDFDLKRKFDLVVCLEVAEHLSPRAAEGFIRSLCRHGDAILFSAAIPGQGGHGHLNEQFLTYWCKIFGQLGYQPLDFIRTKIWEDRSIHWWLRQNIVMFVQSQLLANNDDLGKISQTASGPLSIVHPEVYEWRLKDQNSLIPGVTELPPGDP